MLLGVGLSLQGLSRRNAETKFRHFFKACSPQTKEVTGITNLSVDSH
jgi:hypothetical protein